MIIIIQLFLFLAVLTIRGRYLIGRHLSENEGQPQRLNYVSTNKGRIVARHVGITQQGGIPFIIRKERWYHRFLKNLGIATELKIRDETLDKNFYFTTDFPNHLERATHSGPLLKHWQELFALPVKSLHATPHRLWCVIASKDHEQPESYFEKHYGILDSIAKATAVPPAHETEVSSKRGALAILFICLHAGLVILGIAGMIGFAFDSLDTVDDRELIYKALFAGAGMAAAWFFAITGLLNRSSWVCWVLADFVLFGILGIMLSSVNVVREANMHLPQTPAHVYSQPILKKECVLQCKQRCGRRCTRTRTYPFQSARYCHPLMRPGVMQDYQQRDSVCRTSAWFEYNIEVASWRTQAEAYRFSTNPGLFDRINLGDYLSVPVNEGALFLEWVDTHQITPH